MNLNTVTEIKLPTSPDEIPEWRPGPEIGDMIAKVLIHGTRRLLRRGIARTYISESDELTTIRGRIDFNASMQLVMTRLPRLACSFDELSSNFSVNQILRTTMIRLSRTRGLDPGLRDELKRLDREFARVDVVRLHSSIFRRVPLHRNNTYYGFLLKVCELAFHTTLPDETGYTYRFTDVLRNEATMELVFQAFVRNFYRIEQSAFSVRPLQLKWDAIADTEGAAGLLPVMNTDVFLWSRDRKIIIDTKYYSSTLSDFHGKPSLHSRDLYQLFSYLKNAVTKGSEYDSVEGILLYPTVGEPLKASFLIQGQRVTAATVNLDQPWSQIRSDLLSLISASTPRTAALTPVGDVKKPSLREAVP